MSPYVTFFCAIVIHDIKEEIYGVVREALLTTLTLLKIMIPISIVVKVLKELGMVEMVGGLLSPLMTAVGLPGEAGLVWAAAMVTNIYGGLVVFFSLSSEYTFTVAQVTVLAVMILVAHTLPVEIRIAHAAGVRAWFMMTLRIGAAVVLGWILHMVFTVLDAYRSPAAMLWRPGAADDSLVQWVVGECKNYVMIFVVVCALLSLMHLLKKAGVIDWLNNRLEPLLEFLGMGKNAAPLTIIGMTLGLAYGGGLIIREAQSGNMSKRDVFLSLSFMGLSHSLIEDTLLMAAIGASLSGTLLARVAFTLLVMLVIIRVLRRIPESTFKRFLVR